MGGGGGGYRQTETDRQVDTDRRQKDRHYIRQVDTDRKIERKIKNDQSIIQVMFSPLTLSPPSPFVISGSQ